MYAKIVLWLGRVKLIHSVNFVSKMFKNMKNHYSVLNCK